MATPQTFKVGQAPWESQESAKPASFIVGEAPWEKNTPSEPKTSKFESTVRQGLQGLTGGLSDEFAGGVEAAGRIMGVRGAGGPIKDLSIEPAGPTFDFEDIKKAYQRGRDQERSALKKDTKDNPKISTAANIVGAVASPINKIASGMSLAKGGAVIGGITGFGTSEADDLKGMVADTAIGLGAGAVLGKGADKASPYIQKAASTAKTAIGNKLNDVAEKLAFKATGAMLKDFRNADSKGLVNKVGRYLLDKGIVKAGDDVESVAKKALEDNLAAGQVLDDIYTKAGEVFKGKMSGVGFDPLRDKKEIMAAAKAELGDTVGADAALNKLGKYLDEVAAGHGDGPMHKAMTQYKKQVQEYLPKQRQFLKDKKQYEKSLGTAGSNLDQPVLPGVTDDFQRTGTAQRQVEVQGKPASQMMPEGADLNTQMDLVPLPQRPTPEPFNVPRGDDLLPLQQSMALDEAASNMMLRNSKQGQAVGTELVPRTFQNVDDSVINSGKGQMGFAIAPTAPIRPQKPADIRNPMSPRRTNDIKGAIDNEINYSRNPLSKEPATEKAFYGARKKLLEKVEQGLDDLGGGDLVEALKKANKDYGYSKQASQVANDRVQRESAHKILGLTDTIAGTGAAGYGLATGDWETAVGAMAAKKGLEKYGTAMLASAANKISQRLLRQPQMQKLAAESPKIFGATVYNLVQRMEERGAISFPKAAEQKDIPKKGPEKWANDGVEKLKSHDQGSLNPAIIDKLMKSKKGKDLLIRASDLKPQSKAMEKIANEIKSQYGGE